MTTASDGKNYRTKLYNLDVVISVGYRVKPQRGTQFRIWANRVLKEYLIKGYAVKDNIKLEQYEDLKQTIKVLSNVLDSKELNYTEATGLLRVVTDYSYALDTLDKYDYQRLRRYHQNRILYNSDGSKRIGNNTLVALTLMIAESRTEEMDTMVKVVVNLINKNN